MVITLEISYMYIKQRSCIATPTLYSTKLNPVVSAKSLEYQVVNSRFKRTKVSISNVLKNHEIDFHLQHKLESDTHVVYSPYGKGEKAIVWSLLGLSVLLFVGNAVLTVKTYGDMTGK